MLKPDFYVHCAIWQGALKIIKDRPFLGIGPKTYSLKENRVKYNLPRDIRSSDAHNVFLNIVIGIGYSMLSTESAMLFMAILGLFSSSIKVERV